MIGYDPALRRWCCDVCGWSWSWRAIERTTRVHDRTCQWDRAPAAHTRVMVMVNHVRETTRTIARVSVPLVFVHVVCYTSAIVFLHSQLRIVPGLTSPRAIR